MIGLHVIFDSQSDPGSVGRSLSDLLDSPAGADGFRRCVVHDEDHLAVAFTSYPHYPVTTIDDPDYLILLEGKVYGKSTASLQEELRCLAEWTFHRQAGGQEHQR